MCNNYDWFGWKLIDALSKVLIPLLIALLVYFQTASLARLEMTFKNTETKRQAENDRNNIELKIIELVWDSLKQGNEQEQTRALLLVETLQPDLRIKLAKVVEFEKSNSDALRNRASTIRTVAAKELLKEYKVDIYFSKKNKELANTITELIRGDVRKIVRINKDVEWLKSVGLPLNSNFEIRYEAVMEKPAAKELLSMLQQKYPNDNITLRTVITKTPGTISLILF